MIVLNGAHVVIGGTSAVSPFYAGLLAQSYSLKPRKPMGSVAFLNAAYAAQNKFFDITAGNNGGYSGAEKWDACTGIGRAKAAFFTL